jgi:two-component system, cell cycle response regulator CpdR
MLKILLAEDDESMRVYLTRALERVGYSVTAVDRGTAALPLLSTAAPPPCRCSRARCSTCC